MEMYVKVIQVVGDQPHGQTRTAVYPSGFFGICIIAKVSR